MTVFWFVVALFVLGALLFMLPALLAPRASVATPSGASVAVHRSQLQEAEADLASGLLTPERFVQARQEIERRVLEDTRGAGAALVATPARRTALAVALFVPVFTGALYLQLGNPAAVVPQVASRPVAAGGGGAAAARHSVTPEQIQQMVAALAERLKAQPEDLEGWLMLGRSYTALGRYKDGAAAFRRAADLSPKDANIVADLADLTGMAQGKRLAGEPSRLIQRALDLDPRHVKALALAGSAAFEARDYTAARGFWQRLLAVVPADSPMARSVQGSLAEVAQLESGVAAVKSAPAAALRGEVVVAPELVARIGAGDTLFIFARGSDGSRMPLAIVRQAAQAGPVAFTLDDSQALAPGRKLADAAQVVVGARISKSGQAAPQPGDLLGESAPVAPGTQGLRIRIDRVQP